MGTTTHRIAVNTDAYTDVSGEGNLNCTLVVASGQALRVSIGGPGVPDPATEKYARVTGPSGSSARGSAMTVQGFDPVEGERLWVKSESGDTEVTVMRGSASVSFSYGG
jgi:hypothetical protein